MKNIKRAISEKQLEKWRIQYAAMRSYEHKAGERGFVMVAGIDEAGRGPLAGPVVAAACVLDAEYAILGVNDSKKLSPARRDILFDEIREHCVEYAVGIVDNETIDEINILNATKRAMKMAVRDLSIPPDILLIDAVRLDDTGIRYVPIIKGDSLSVSIAAASILAKVTRDRIMVSYDLEWPGYGFAQHKGYGTAMHYDAISRLGITPIHRRSFLKKILRPDA